MTITIRDLNEFPHAVELPAGWRRVRRGALVPGDRFLDLRVLTEFGQVYWRPVGQPELDRALPHGMYGTAEWYECLIRKEHLG